MPAGQDNIASAVFSRAFFRTWTPPDFSEISRLLHGKPALLDVTQTRL